MRASRAKAHFTWLWDIRVTHARPLFAAILAGILLALPAPILAEQQMLHMEAAVSHNEIFLGEALQLTIMVHGYQPELGQPDLSALPADIELIGQQNHSQQSIQIINGVQQVTRVSGRQFTYRVVPHRSGNMSLASIRLTGPDGRLLPINDRPILVRPIPEQDYVQVWVDAPDHVIVDESFEVTLFLRIQKPTRPYQEHSPIPPGTAPHLSIPYLDLHPTEGLQSENITQLLQRMLVQEGEAFQINNRAIGRDPFGGIFGRDQAAFFRLPRITDPQNEDYYLYELRSRWSADREGDYTFGPARFRGQLITYVSPTAQADQSNIYAVAEPVTVQVRNPPAAGRPATFIGVAGNRFAVQTSLDTQLCQTGDPVTLTIEITGDGPAHRIRAPRAPALAPLETDFRLQPEPMQSESIQGGRRFTYLIRPRHAGTLEIPALEIAYFDLATRTYQTIWSDPMPIRVNPSEELEFEAITGSERGRIRISITAAPGDLPPAPFAFPPA
ncbi:MAG: BatD family protein, partial [Kiritimatiellia bacterium]